MDDWRTHQNQGSRNGNAILSEDQVRRIWELHDQGYTSKQIAELIGIGEDKSSTVRNVWTFQTWIPFSQYLGRSKSNAE